MSTSRSNKNKTSGLRFLWIPGRKKSHGHKGRYDTTNKTVQHPGGGTSGQKKNEPWSLGGGKGLEKLVESDIPGGSEGTSRIISALPTTYAIAAGATSTVMKLDDTNQFAYLDEDEKDEKDASNNAGLMKTTANNSDSTKQDSPTNNNQEKQNNSKNKSSEKDDRGGDKVEANGKKNNNHNSKSKDDINSIESFPEKKLKDSAFDITDSSLYVGTYNGKKKKNKKKKKTNKNCPNDGDDEEDDDPDKNIVKCLYFTLMCCECTIS